MSRAKQTDFVRTALRVPPKLHAGIHEAATANGRTFNAEIVARLEESFAGERGVTAAGQADMRDLAEELKKQISRLKHFADAVAEFDGMAADALLEATKPRGAAKPRKR